MKTHQKINFFSIDRAFWGSLLCTRFTNHAAEPKTSQSQLNELKKVNLVQFGDLGKRNGEILKAGQILQKLVNLGKTAISLKFTNSKEAMR